MTMLHAFGVLYVLLCAGAGVYYGWCCYDEQPLRDELGRELRWLHYPIGFLCGAVVLMPMFAMIGLSRGVHALLKVTK